MQLYVGCAGWSYTSWKNHFYPSTIDSSLWVEGRKISTSFLLEVLLVNYKYSIYYLISSVTEIDWNELIKLKKSVMACDKYFCGNVIAQYHDDIK
jgi:hypothetical protein